MPAIERNWDALHDRRHSEKILVGKAANILR